MSSNITCLNAEKLFIVHHVISNYLIITSNIVSFSVYDIIKMVEYTVKGRGNVCNFNYQAFQTVLRESGVLKQFFSSTLSGK